jgi:hypothetical protein
VTAYRAWHVRSVGSTNFNNINKDQASPSIDCEKMLRGDLDHFNGDFNVIEKVNFDIALVAQLKKIRVPGPKFYANTRCQCKIDSHLRHCLFRPRWEGVGLPKPP